MNRLPSFFGAGCLLALGLLGKSLPAQVTEEAPNIYVDCFWCDEDFIQIEIPYVNYVRDRYDADIHVLITTQGTGSGGREYTLAFLGRNVFETISDTLVVTADETDSEDLIRQDLVRVLKLGLVPYLSRTPLAKNLSVSFIEDSEQPRVAVQDKWKSWVFSVRLRSNLNGEQLYKSTYLSGSLSARRVTEDWKISVSASGSYDEDTFTFDDQDFSSISRSNSVNGSIIMSLTDHWSVGLWGFAYSSTYDNIDYALSVLPGIEYNYFPYSESTRRQLRFGYKVTPIFADYTEETIYLKTHERLTDQSLSLTLDLIQPWGSVNTSLTGSHYLHDLTKNRVRLFTGVSLKLIKGLSLNLYGNVSMIRDQLSLPRGVATLEEVLLRRKQLETQYDYWGSVGFTYSFGSIYTHVVNPRFGGTGGRVFFF
ncbi:MAG: hypothetical protein ACE5HZ_02335 [Fidelibacterota bacterium]